MTTSSSPPNDGNGRSASAPDTAAPEAAALPEEARAIDAIPGSRGAPAPPGMSARDFLVRGKAPFTRKHTRKGPFESIIGTEDQRARILDTDTDPWRMICSLEIWDERGAAAIGTGWLAGPRTIITAGHCVFDRDLLGGWATRILVRPARNGAREPFARLEPTSFSATKLWIEDARNKDHDYGAIHLGPEARAVTEKIGWFATAALADADLLKQRVNVSGYPLVHKEQPTATPVGSEQWFHAKQILHVTPLRIYYDVDTTAGQSGAPAWLDLPEGPRVVGIHAYGVDPLATPDASVNSGPRITSDVLEQIRGWIDKP